MDLELIQSIIPHIAAVILALISGFFMLKTKKLELKTKNLKEENEKASEQVEKAKIEERKAKIELSALAVLFDTKFFNFLEEKVGDIFNNTRATRFLILYAINGKTDFKHATVTYEHIRGEKGKGAIKRYTKVKIDDGYRNLLKVIEEFGSFTLNVNEMNKEDLLYKIYTMPQEEVNHSIVKFIARKRIDENNDLIFYSTIATTDNEEFTQGEKTYIRMIFSHIREMSKTIQIQLDN